MGKMGKYEYECSYLFLYHVKNRVIFSVKLFIYVHSAAGGKNQLTGGGGYNFPPPPGYSPLMFIAQCIFPSISSLVFDALTDSMIKYTIDTMVLVLDGNSEPVVRASR